MVKLISGLSEIGFVLHNFTLLIESSPARSNGASRSEGFLSWWAILTYKRTFKKHTSSHNWTNLRV